MFYNRYILLPVALLWLDKSQTNRNFSCAQGGRGEEGRWREGTIGFMISRYFHDNYFFSSWYFVLWNIQKLLQVQEVMTMWRPVIYIYIYKDGWTDGASFDRVDVAA